MQACGSVQAHIYMHVIFSSSKKKKKAKEVK